LGERGVVLCLARTQEQSQVVLECVAGIIEAAPILAKMVIINKTPLSYRTNRIIGGVAPSNYLNRLESSGSKDPPIKSDVLDQILRTH
jgi:hypothetical protein